MELKVSLPLRISVWMLTMHRCKRNRRKGLTHVTGCVRARVCGACVRVCVVCVHACMCV